MTRNAWIWSALACFGFLPTVTRADYYLLIMDLAKTPKFDGGGASGQPGMPGGGDAGGGPGMGGPGGGRAGGGGRPGGGPGMGGMPGGAGMAGMPGAGGRPGGGMAGMPGGGGIAGGAGMAGMMGGMPGMGDGGTGFPGLGGSTGPEPNLIYAIVALGEEREVGDGLLKKQQMFQAKMENGMPVVATHAMGGALAGTVLINNPQFNMTVMPLSNTTKTGRAKEPSVRLTRARFDAYINTVKQVSSSSGTLDIAKWALEHGLLDSFHEYMTKVPTRDDYKSNPSAVRLYGIYSRLKKEIEGRGAKNPSENILVRLGLDPKHLVEGLDDPKAHYLIISPGDVDDLKDRQKMLEDHFQAFYYTFAMRGIELKVPEEKLTVYFPKNDGKGFKEMAALYQPGSETSSGFLIRGSNTLVITPTRDDANFLALTRLLKPFWERGYNKDALLKLPPPKPGEAFYGNLIAAIQAKAIPSDPNFMGSQTAQNEAVFVMMANILRKSLQHEAELAAITNYSTRQLAQASGFLPEGILPPAWVENGLAHFMETPMGTPWRSVGGPNSVMVPAFRRHRKGALAKGETTPGEIVQKIVTDQYFIQASKNLSDKGAMTLAQCSAWSLTHYLINQNPEGYRRYCSMLGDLAPGVEASPKILDEIFAKAFAKSPTANPQQTYNDVGRSWWVNNQFQVDNADTLVSNVRRLQKEFGIEEAAANSPISLLSLLSGLAVPASPQGGAPGMPGMGMPGMGMPGMGGPGMPGGGKPGGPGGGGNSPGAIN